MTTRPTARRLGVVLRHGERVSELELFFDLVFVLAITQCTALMSHHPTWRGIGEGLVLLGLLWWSWVGFSWLTSVVDPDETGVRLVLFAAMAALLVTSLSVPHAYGELGLTLAVAYGAVRAAHIALFTLASRSDPGLRHSVVGLAISTSVGVGLLVVGALLPGMARLAVWALALVLDMGGPLVIDTSGWRLVPHHFAERHGLIVIVALGESIVAIGVGAGDRVDAGVVVTAVAGIAVAAALWWAYFDVAAVLADRRLAEEPDVTARNELARDAYSYLHLVLVAGIVLVALGGKTALADVDEGLAWPAAAALAGGAAAYLFGQVAFKRRSIGTLSLPRLVAGVVVLAVVPLAHATSGLVAVVAVAVVLWTLLGVEGVRYAEVRRRTRAELHGHSHDGG